MHLRLPRTALLALTLSFSVFSILPSLAQASLYAPGATLDPACSPTDVSCGVIPSVGTGTQGQVPYYAANGQAVSATSSITILQNGNITIGTTSVLKIGSLAESGPNSTLSINGSLAVSSSVGESYFANIVSGTTGTYKSNVLALYHSNPVGAAAMRFLRQSDAAEVGAVGYQNGTNGFYLNNSTYLAASQPYINGTTSNSLAPTRLILGQEGAYNNNFTAIARFMADTDWTMKFFTPNNVSQFEMDPDGTVQIGSNTTKLISSTDGTVSIGFSTTTNLINGTNQFSLLGSSAGNYNLLIKNDSTSTVAAAQLALQVGGTGGSAGSISVYPSNWSFHAYPANGIAMVSNTSGGNSIMSTNAAGIITFFTGGDNTTNERLRITNSGKVGIGTTTPGYLLTVGGNQYVSSRLRVGYDSPSSITNSNFGSLQVMSQSGSAISSSISQDNVATGQSGFAAGSNVFVSGFDGPAMAFQFNPTSAFTGSELMRLTSAGKLGIGTTTPWRTFSVTGTVGFDGLGAITGVNSSLCLDSNKQVVFNSNNDSCASSLRSTKHDITPLTLAGTTTIAGLTPVSYIYNNDASSTVRYGFIADDASVVDPHLGSYDQNGQLSGIDERGFLAITIKALQELIATVSGFATNFVSAHITVTTGDFQKVNTQELCIDGTCITGEEFRALLNKNKEASGVGVQQEQAPQEESPVEDTGSSTPPVE